MWVRSLGGIASWICVRLARVKATITNSTGMRHHVGRNGTMLHPRVHSARVIHEARWHVWVLLLSWLGASTAGSSIMAVKVQDFFRTFRSLGASLSMTLFCWAAAAAPSTGMLPAFTLPFHRSTRVWPSFRHGSRGHQTNTTGTLRTCR